MKFWEALLVLLFGSFFFFPFDFWTRNSFSFLSIFLTKNNIAQFTAAQLITKRELVSNIIKKKLTDRAADFHLTLDDVSITHLDFAPEYTAAVEAKQVAQQQSERAKFTVEKALQVKEEIIVTAEAEAL